MELKFKNPDGTYLDSKGRFTFNNIMFFEVMALAKLKFKSPRSDTNEEERKAKRVSTNNLNVPSQSDSRPQSSRSPSRSEAPKSFQSNNQGNQHELYVAVDDAVAPNLSGTKLDVNKLAELLQQKQKEEIQQKSEEERMRARQQKIEKKKKKKKKRSFLP